MAVGTIFAVLLVAASIFELKPKLQLMPVRPASDKTSGQVEGVSTPAEAPSDASFDTANWKTYRDPAYHFTLKYPDNWEDPVAKKINDPDFEYEYQVSFGSKETLAGENFDGFNLYVFQTEKCSALAGAKDILDGSAGETVPRCSTKKSTVDTGAESGGKILEFSSIAYTYTIVPYIPPENADSGLVKKINLELDEIGKTFQYNTALRVPVPPKKTQPPPTAAPPKPPAPVGKRGKLTGAVASGGKLVCPHPNRKPKKSPTQGNHVDEDCCPDPDEYPNAACSYKPSDYKIML